MLASLFRRSRLPAGQAGAGETIGLIAGSGEFPCLVAEAVRARGFPLVVAAVERADGARLKGLASRYADFGLGDAERVLGYLRENRLRGVLLAGGVPKSNVYRTGFKPDGLARKVLDGVKIQGDDRMLKAICAVLSVNGIRVLNPAQFLSDRITPKGVLTRRKPAESELRDVRFGLKAVRAVGRLDIGQTVIVRNGAVIAVEAIEGTDATLERTAGFGLTGCVMVKTAKPQQDLRFDMPVAGTGTVDRAAAAGCAVIALEAGRSLILDPEAAVRRADELGLSIVGVS